MQLIKILQMRKLLLIAILAAIGGLNAQTNLNPNSVSKTGTVSNLKTYTSCGYLQENNAFEDGRISQTGWPLVCAENFVVPASECWDVGDITVNFFVNNPADNIQVFFYSDNAGTPGTVIASEVIPFGNCTLTLLGNNWGLNVYEYAFALATPVNLCGGASGTTFWFSVQAISNNNHYWEFTNLPTYGSNGMSAPSQTGPWTIEGDNYVFELITATTFDTTIVECAPYSITIGSNTYNSTGVYTETLTSVFGCDSIVTLDLTVNSGSTGTDVQSACGSYTWIDNNTYSTDTMVVYTITGGASNGCDSVVTLELNILPSATGTEVQSACGSYTWIDNNTYSTDTMVVYTITGGAANGCDSVVTLDLTILPEPDVSMTISGITLTVGDPTGTYQWIDCNNNNIAIGGANSQSYTPTSNGDYAVVVTSPGGCVDTSLCYSVTTIGLDELINTEKKLVKIVDFAGRETNFKPNTPLIFIYSDGTRERIMKIED